jgi:hypothetical protein
VAQQPKSGIGRLLLEVSRSHSDTRQSVGLLWTSDQSVAETSTWQHTNTHKRQTSMPPVGFEPTIPASARPNAHALHCAATGIGCCSPIIHNSSAECIYAFHTFECATPPDTIHVLRPLTGGYLFRA